ncbi:MAG TPA: class I tRNA ligase family protein [Acidimicrobiales bacterium]|nr:class I tRNA ligase family protein [Acidimicrobiales bacterium]
MPGTSFGSAAWREWTAQAPAPPTPAGVGPAARHLTAGGAPSTLRLGGVELPVLGRARVYVCGITPYDTTHLGHAATFVWADMAARVLRLTGAEVEVCRNITDVDDELLRQASADRVAWRSLASQQTYRFEQDMADLGVTRPMHEPRAYDYVDDVIRLAAALLATGAAYERNGSVFFRQRGVAERAGLSREQALALASERGGRPEDPDKDDPLDAALWLRSVATEPGWESPWGRGRPGWHAECTAMALATLGPSIDIHAGGADLSFPHHAFEAAQAEAFTGVAPFARAWMHVGTVMMDGRKMAKSTGNLVFVHDLLERWPAGALRLLILSRPWADPWDFRAEDLDAAAERLEHLWQHGSRRSTESAAAEVAGALLDDLDVRRALDVASDSGGQVLRDLVALLGLR